MSGRRVILEVPADTRHAQARATSPDASAWVSANAGSGKTHVLVWRVIRLLIAGTDPGRILCLTYTKAAAATMAARVFDTLASFATLSEADLARQLAEIEGGTVDPGATTRARRLFARALETPGGLKIQTIHAFCASLLAQFPLEANVAGRFAVMDDRLAAELAETALAAVLRETVAHPDGTAARALDTLLPVVSDGGLGEAIKAVVARREEFREWLRGADDLDDAIARLGTTLGLAPGDTPESLMARILDERLLAGDDLVRLHDALAASGANAQKRAADIDASGIGTHEARTAAWCSFLLTEKSLPRAAKTALSAAVEKAHPDLADLYVQEQGRVLALLDRRRAAAAVVRTAALARLADAVLARVEAEKRRRGLIDYADQIRRAADLLSRSDASAWIRYKLDQSIDHILVDEAQDTSPLQWQVVRDLAAEFFAGAGARAGRRTVFAVGDEKQSIYGFQGAAPAAFAAERRGFQAQAVAAREAFHDVRLTLSFRSTQDVLAAVDRVFADPAAREGLSADGAAPVHQAIRASEIGCVEVWPLFAPDERSVPDDWREPIDRIGMAHPSVRLAERIAETIHGWIAAGEPLPDGRPVRAGDVLVLVRKRGPFVEALSRALKRRGVPVAGTDRLVLGEHIAVQDLVALGRVLALPADDLSLAAVLKSPLFDVDEALLFDLAHGRPGTLVAALADSTEPRAQAAHARLSAWRSAAARQRPFELYTTVLGRDGGRRRFLARLGPEVDEVLDAFLDLVLEQERNAIPTLDGFLAWFAAAPAIVKREAETAGDALRVMTVHGAKGLEAPVVFVADDGSGASHPSHDPKLFSLPPLDGAAACLVWAAKAGDRPAACEPVLAETRRLAAEEHRRLLYVALTRAADRLVVCGWRGKRAPSEDAWHALVERALAPDAEEVRDADGALAALRWQAPRTAAAEPDRQPSPALPADDVTVAATAEEAGLPAWVDRAAAAPAAVLALSPSSALADDDDAATVASRARLADPTALVRGRLIHRLIEALAALPADARADVAARFLAREAPDLDGPMAAAIAAEALGVLADPALARLFGEGGRAEVPIAGTFTRDDGALVTVAGRIDRLAVLPDRVLAIDLKTDRRVPADAGAVAPAYVAQMALYRALLADLYPGRLVKAAILYTTAPRLVTLPAAALDALLARLLTAPTP
jgi:ATP-dependent helicase/nuclease subunit A